MATTNPAWMVQLHGNNGHPTPHVADPALRGRQQLFGARETRFNDAAALREFVVAHGKGRKPRRSR